MRLEVDGLAFGYRDQMVGQDVSFRLAAGEVLCLLGPNGSGKTTLFKTVLRLLPPKAGTVAVDGEPIARWSRRRLARSLGYVPQAQAVPFPFTLREIVLMGRTAHVGLFAAPSRRDREVAEETLASLDIGHLAARPYTEVSGGERQLALVARALAQEPRILVMDEPTASLDFGNQVRVLAEIQALAGRGIAVVLSTHDPDHAFLCAHRVALLHGGTAGAARHAGRGRDGREPARDLRRGRGRAGAAGRRRRPARVRAPARPPGGGIIGRGRSAGGEVSVGLIWDGLVRAVGLVLSGDPEVLGITWLSLRLSATATLLSLVVGIPLGTALALVRFPGRRFAIALVNTGMGLPPVVVGLFISILLWRSGPLGFLELLYTPPAIVMAQFVIAAPLVVGLTLAAVQQIPERFRLQMLALGASRGQLLWVLVREARLPLLAALMAGFGAVISEVGASLMVGGNIRGQTRVLTTATVLETGKGNFDVAIALSVILLGLTFLVNWALTVLQQRRHG